jgi:Kef-type K+ transport system membrane component KefB
MRRCVILSQFQPFSVGRTLDNIGFIQDMGVMIIAAAVVLLLLRRLNVPSIVSFILTGLVLSVVPGLLHLEAGVSTQHQGQTPVELISEMGALLMFLVGLELSFDRIRDVGRFSLIAGSWQVGFIAVVGFLLAILMGFEFWTAVFIAVALTNSSTVLAVKILDQKRETHRKYAHIVVGINLIKDVILIVALTFVGGLAAAEDLDIWAVIKTLATAFIGVISMAGFAAISARYILPRPTAWAATTQQTLLMWSMAWCFLFVLAAMWFGLSSAIGAFMAGISLAQLAVAEDLRRRVHPLMTFFLALFFVSVGVQMELGAALALWWAVIPICLLAQRENGLWGADILSGRSGDGADQ